MFVNDQWEEVKFILRERIIYFNYTCISWIIYPVRDCQYLIIKKKIWNYHVCLGFFLEIK